MKEKRNVIIISVGGSIIIPKNGFDSVFLRRFKKLFLKHARSDAQYIMVVGGGETCRMYQDAAKRICPMKRDELDWIGIQTTRLNAEFVRVLFEDSAYEEVVTDPTKKVKTSKPIIIAAGYKPGHSTDMDAVLLAQAYGAKEIVNLSNIDFVYTKDPHRHTDVKKIPAIDWHSFRQKLVPKVWKPGAHVPFDPIASKKAQALRLTVLMIRGTDLREVDNALSHKKFQGSIIHP